jgi:hypothetical protein
MAEVVEDSQYPLELEFGRFKFLRLLAAGGQGSVTLYHDTEEG